MASVDAIDRNARPPSTTERSPHVAAGWRIAALLALGVVLVVGAQTHLRPPDAGDAATYVSGARSIASGHGYRAPDTVDGVPRYAPGVSLLLVPAAWISHGPVPMQATSYAIGLLLIVAIWWCARSIGGDPAAFGAALLVLASPGVLRAGSEIMSDAPSALLVVVGLTFLVAERERAAGIAFGVACLMRLDAVVFVPGLGRRRALIAAAWVIAALVAFQLVAHGSVGGYRGDEATFGLGYLTHGTVLEAAGNASSVPNWRFYPEVLLGRGGLLVAGAPFLAGWALWRRRDQAFARTAMWIVASTFAVYLVYYFQSARFLLPVFAIATIFGGVAVGDVLDSRFRPRPVGSREP